MAYREEAKKVSLRINYENGLREDGEMKTRSKTINDINLEATSEQVGKLAGMLAGFMKDKFVNAKKVVEYDLVDDSQTV